MANVLNVIRKEGLLRDSKGFTSGQLVEYHGLSFFVTNEATANRAIYAVTKEPDTVKWIEHFGSGCTFWDVGANVGVFSLYAAHKRAARVLAFEPVFSNYFILNRSIAANKLEASVRAYGIAVGDKTGFVDMVLSSLGEGAALHGCGEGTEGSYRQPVACFTIDDLVAKFAFAPPTHIKIDVDGYEASVIAGARKVLTNRAVKTLMVELATGTEVEVRDAITEAGFVLAGKFHRLEQSPYRNHLFVRPNDQSFWRQRVYDALEGAAKEISSLPNEGHDSSR